MIVISVLTPTFNRSSKLMRLYDSLEKQTYRNFEWVIVNDGSTDDTESVIELIKKRASFPIKSLYQHNSGKHVALNRLYENAQGEYCFQIDDDDELLPNAMEQGLSAWNSIREDKDCYWCVCGRCIDSKSKQIVGDPFPKEINEYDAKKRKQIACRTAGEKCGLQKTAYVKQFSFPEIKECTFISEDFLWNRLDSQYMQLYVNIPFRVYYQNDGASLMNREKSTARYASDFCMYRLMFIDIYTRNSADLKKIAAWVFLLNNAAHHTHHNIKETTQGMALLDKILLVLGWLPTYIVDKIHK